jgi:hypothetical protein
MLYSIGNSLIQAQSRSLLTQFLQNVIKCKYRKAKWSAPSLDTRNTKQIAHCSLLPRARLQCGTRKDVTWTVHKNTATVPLSCGGIPQHVCALPFKIYGVYRILLQLPCTALVWTELNDNNRKEGWETCRCDGRSLNQIQKELDLNRETF